MFQDSVKLHFKTSYPLKNEKKPAGFLPEIVEVRDGRWLSALMQVDWTVCMCGEEFRDKAGSEGRSWEGLELLPRDLIETQVDPSAKPQDGENTENTYI